jgi:Cu2+-exporting ATPase
VVGVLCPPTALERMASRPCRLTRPAPTLGWPELVAAAATRSAADRGVLAANSRHPLAQAPVRAAPDTALLRRDRHSGQGLQRGDIRLGSARFCGVADPEDDGRSELWLTRPGARPVRFAFADRLRRDAAEAVAALQRAGLTVELLSGDRPAAVARAAAEAGVTQWRAETSPAAKAERLAALAAQGKRILMVGDGLNDAPALAAAHASISPATAAEATLNAADAVFQGDAAAGRRDLRGARRAIAWCADLGLALLCSAVPLAILGIDAGGRGRDVFPRVDRNARARVRAPGREDADGQPAHPGADALVLGHALAAFLWALRNGQYDDPEGAAGRILFDDDD